VIALVLVGAIAAVMARGVSRRRADKVILLLAGYSNGNSGDTPGGVEEYRTMALELSTRSVARCGRAWPR